MKPSAFTYERPTNVEQALASKARWGASARFLAGGQSLMPAMNMRFNTSDCLIDLNGIEAMRGIREENNELIIGAMTRHAEVASSELVRRKAPLLVQASRHLAHAAIRNRGTFGGSVALADPAAEWPAACLLLDARIRMTGPGGAREVPAAAFFQGMYMTALEENDLLESVVVPAQAAQERSCVLELARRQGDFATAAVMARAHVQGKSISQLRLMFFAVGDTPIRDADLDLQVQDATNSGDLAGIGDRVKTALMAQELRADLYAGPDTKRHLCSVLARRAVTQLIQT